MKFHDCISESDCCHTFSKLHKKFEKLWFLLLYFIKYSETKLNKFLNPKSWWLYSVCQTETGELFCGLDCCAFEFVLVGCKMGQYKAIQEFFSANSFFRGSSHLKIIYITQQVASSEPLLSYVPLTFFNSLGGKNARESMS